MQNANTNSQLVDKLMFLMDTMSRFFRYKFFRNFFVYTYSVCTYLSMNQIMCIKTGWLIPVRITTEIFLYNILFKENLLSNVNFVCPIMPMLYSMNSTKSSNFILNFCPQENILSCSVINTWKNICYYFDNIVDIMKQWHFCIMLSL